MMNIHRSVVAYTVTLEFFLNEAELSLNSVISANSGNLINHWSINWAQFKGSFSHMCLAGTEVAFWSLTQKVEGSRPFNDYYFLYLNSPNSAKIFRKTPISSCVWSLWGLTSPRSMRYEPTQVIGVRHFSIVHLLHKIQEVQWNPFSTIYVIL